MEHNECSIMSKLQNVYIKIIGGISFYQFNTAYLKHKFLEQKEERTAKRNNLQNFRK